MRTSDRSYLLSPASCGAQSLCVANGKCAKLRYDFPEVSIVRLLDVLFRGIARFDVAVHFALGRGLLAQLLYMLDLG